MPKLVSAFEHVVENILAYQRGVAEHPELAARIPKHPAWYAVRDKNGEWLFGPSKFVGYRDADAASYLATSYNRRDGKETEPALRAWFETVDNGSALGRELRAAFERFAEQYGKTANARWRVAVAPEQGMRVRRAGSGEVSQRIAFDPDICSGRPHIRGTRIRVSDIVAALAEGETQEDLLAEFPYLSAADIQAALQYAASTLDHLVLVAA